MATVSTLDEMRANRVGFGSFIKRDAEPFRIRSLADVLDFDANNKAKKDANGDLVIKEFTIPLESDEKVKRQISKPSLGGKRSDDATKYHSSALVHILETLQNNNKAILTSGRDASHGIINDLLQGGESTENYKEFDVFFDKPRAGQPISGGEGRSVAKLLPSAVIGEGSLKKEDSLTKQQKNRLKERFKQLGKTTPLSLENDVVGADGKKRKPTGKTHVASTPMVHYYQSRYIASMLLDKAKEAVATKTSDLTPISSLTGAEEDIIARSIDISPDVRTEVDQIFDMYPVGTTIKFRDKSSLAVGGDEIIVEGNHIDIGILQRMYALYDNPQRKKFRENVAEIIRSIPVTQAHRNSGRSAGDTYYSIDPEILESVLVWINDTEFEPPKKKRAIKFIDEISPDSGSISFATLPLGSIMEMPGWMLFEYAEDNGESLMGRFDERFSGEWIDRFEMLSQLMMDYEDDYEAKEEIESNWVTIEEMMQASISGTLVETTDEDITIEYDLRPFLDSEVVRVVFDKDRLMSNEMEKQELDNFRAKYEQSRMQSYGLKSTRGTVFKDSEGEDTAPWELSEKQIVNGGQGTDYQSQMGFELVVREGEGISVAYPQVIDVYEGKIETDIGMSRAFQALGEVLMYLVKNNGVDEAKGYSSRSVFDRCVSGLLGRYNKPGPAPYHAQLHHDLLYAMTRDALKQVDSGQGLVSLGASLVFEQYANNPSKLMVMWMLANYKLIDMGGIDEDGVPSFFTMPMTEFDTKTAEAQLMNTMALIIISYYRLAFYPLRLRAKGKEKTQFSMKNWEKLQKDASSDGPEPYAFAAVLKFLSQADGLKVEIPAWMPGLPENFAALERTRNKEEVAEYISWAYGSNPTSVEHFCEIAAAYHAAKALSYYEPGRYAEMVKTFVDAVEAERGEGFLISVLIAYNQEERLPTQAKAPDFEGADVEKIQIVGGKL